MHKIPNFHCPLPLPLPAPSLRHLLGNCCYKALLLTVRLGCCHSNLSWGLQESRGPPQPTGKITKVTATAFKSEDQTSCTRRRESVSPVTLEIELFFFLHPHFCPPRWCPCLAAGGGSELVQHTWSRRLCSSGISFPTALEVPSPPGPLQSLSVFRRPRKLKTKCSIRKSEPQVW